MRHRIKDRSLFSGIAAILCAACLNLSLITSSASGLQKQATPPAVASFDKGVKVYAKLRERLEEKLPSLSKDAKPEEIEAHIRKFEAIVREARTGAKRGDIFTPDVADYFRATIKANFKGQDRKELRETVLEADNKDVALRVNHPYPETKELTEMPATLLLKLPELPKQVKYRFVRRHLLLVDRENGLIVDYMLNALP
jgi:hypothetical protein